MKQINTSDKDLQLIQNNAQESFTSIETSLFQNGILLSGQLLTSGQDNLISHTLNRVPQIVVVALQNADSRIWETAMDNRTVTVRCSNTVTASLWVS